jgi:Raf kinase inhibitor-like YbhB/YbcL family protein
MIFSNIHKQEFNRFLLFFCFIFFIAGFLQTSMPQGVKVNKPKQRDEKMSIKLQSNAFKEGEMIPAKYTCSGEGISPELKWSKFPKATKTFAIILNDPDAPSGDFVHWIVYNIPANVKELHEDVTPTRNVPDEVEMGTNSAGRVGYFGPCPPSGTHHYIFRIYALNTVLHLEAGAEKHVLLKAMEGHILAEGKLMGRYKK